MVTHIGGGERAVLPCPLSGAHEALLLLGQQQDALPWGRRLLTLVRSPAITRVYLCAVCDEVVSVCTSHKDDQRHRAS